MPLRTNNMRWPLWEVCSFLLIVHPSTGATQRRVEGLELVDKGVVGLARRPRLLDGLEGRDDRCAPKRLARIPEPRARRDLKQRRGELNIGLA